MYKLEQQTCWCCNEYKPIEEFGEYNEETYGHVCRTCLDSGLWARRQERSARRSLAYYSNPKRRAQRALINLTKRSVQYGVKVDFTEDDYFRMFDYFGYACVFCGRKHDDPHPLCIDHWIAIADGGPSVRTNLIPICWYCNTSKCRRKADKWLVWKFGAESAAATQAKVLAYFQSFGTPATLPIFLRG